MSAGLLLLRLTVDSVLVVLGGTLVATSVPILSDPDDPRYLKVIVCTVDAWLFALLIGVGIWMWFA
jgi:hypothetical protein